MSSLMITDNEAKELKTWVIRKLEDISDADSDVLADYVLALIRADTPEPELRANAIENLEDFLKEHTSIFVDETLNAIRTKSYIPGYVPPILPGLITSSTAPPSGPASYGPLGANDGFGGGQNQSRKRSYNDRQDDSRGRDSHYGRGDRQIKQMRRGNMSNGQGRGSHGAFNNGFPPPTVPGLNLPLPNTYPGMPMPPPFDPNDPVGAILAMQAMGLPPLGIPDLAMAGSPTGFLQVAGRGSGPTSPQGRRRINARCRDYDTKGFCARGAGCPFDHGNNQIIVPPTEEYDPNNSLMLDVQTNPQTSNGFNNSNNLRGASGHSRSSTRSDRGGGNITRRNRAEFSMAGPNHDRSITTIVVEQIPEEHFEEKQVRDFFAEFGIIEQVTMQAYKRLALVKYNDYYAAKAAYDSPKVIFDNRFVKVYWYNPDSTPAVKTNGAAGSPPPTKAEEPAFDKEKFERDSQAAQKKLEERKALLQATEAKRKEIEKAKEELDRKRAEEKRKLEEKLKAKGMSLSDVGLDDTSKATNCANGKTSAQTEALRAQVAALEKEAMEMGIDPNNLDELPSTRSRGRGRGRGSYRGWEGFAGRGAPYESSRGYHGRGGFGRGRGGGAYNLDNRTKKVKVEGVVFDEDKDEGLKHFLIGIGEYDSIEPTDSKDAQIVTFKDRFTAEKLMYGTKDISGVGKVEFSWVNTPLPPVKVKADEDVDMVDMKREDVDDGGMGRDQGGGEVDYDVAEEDERWMVT